MVIEESLCALGQAVLQFLATESHVGEGLHLAAHTCQHAVHRIASFDAEGATSYTFIPYLGERVGLECAPGIVDLLDHLRMAQILKDILSVEASGEVAFLRVPVGVVIVMVELRCLVGMLFAEILCAESTEEGIGGVAFGIPHHGGVGTHLHKEFTQVTGVDDAERQWSLALDVAVVVLHLPRSFGGCQVSTCRVELQIHVITQLHVVGVRPVDKIIVGIMIAAASHEGPQHIRGSGGLQVSGSQQRGYLIVERHADEGVVLAR